MVIPQFDMSSLFGTLPCPTCNNMGYVFVTKETASTKTYLQYEEEKVRHKLYGEYEEWEK